MKYKPRGNRIIGKIKHETEKKSESGLIHLPANSETEKYDEIKIVAVGRGYITQNGTIAPMESKVGDIVLVAKNGSMPLPTKDTDLGENEEYVVFQESDIIAVKEYEEEKD